MRFIYIFIFIISFINAQTSIDPLLDKDFKGQLKWVDSIYNNMNIDDGPLLMQLSDVIKDSNKKGKIALEASSFLSLHTSEIYKKFQSKFIILLRNPYDVSFSLKKKGWYQQKYILNDIKKISGYQGVATSFHNKHHNFCRISNMCQAKSNILVQLVIYSQKNT